MAGQQHLDRLSAIDAGFLAQEKPNTHMHIGALALFDGKPPELDEFLGKVGFGLLGDYDALPDLDVVAEGIEASLAQLVELAKKG